MTYAIRPATLVDAFDLAPRLRPADLAEIEAASGRPAADVLADSVERSLWSEALLIDDRVEALGGLTTGSVLFGPGIPWLLGSDRMTQSVRWFMSQSRRQVTRMLGTYDVLVNWVDARNTTSVRYLRKLGFTIEAPTVWGAAGLPFHRFHMERPNV